MAPIGRKKEHPKSSLMDPTKMCQRGLILLYPTCGAITSLDGTPNYIYMCMEKLRGPQLAIQIVLLLQRLQKVFGVISFIRSPIIH